MLSINPNPVAFYLPLISNPITWHPVTWYGLFFASGVMLSLWQLKSWLKKWGNLSSKDPLFSEINTSLEKLLIVVVMGILIGARSFEVLFYSPHISLFSLEFFKTWNGGLSSHGGLLGLIIALLLSWTWLKRELWVQKLQLQLGDLLDGVAGASLIAASMVRLGNCFNQEIVGRPSTLPWAIIFENPAGGLLPVARHPVQLYEALAYFLLWIWARSKLQKAPHRGKIAADLAIALFTCRIALEFFKAPLTWQDSQSLWQMGQWLSLPALFGAMLFRFYLSRSARSPRS